MRFNKKWFTLIEIAVWMLLLWIVLALLSNLTITSYQRYIEHKKNMFVYEEVSKISSFFRKINFANGIEYIDENPVNHPNLSNVRFSVGNDEFIEISPIDLWIDDTNDIEFIDTDNQSRYMYDTKILDIKYFRVTELDNTINRWGVLIEMRIWLDPNNNLDARRWFWQREFYIDFKSVYTFRNSLIDDEL